jgi:hypothetical protein
MLSKHRKKEQEPAAAEVAAETAEPVLDPLEEARAEAAKNWDLYLRERAELENFRKRTQRDKEEFRIFTRKELLLEVLPVLDNLERALSHAGQNGEAQGLLEGVNMTVVQFRKVIEDFGARPIAACTRRWRRWRRPSSRRGRWSANIRRVICCTTACCARRWWWSPRPRPSRRPKQTKNNSTVPRRM